MTELEKKTIKIAEVTRVEGHSAVHVEISDGQVTDVQMSVTEGLRFFERMLVGHKFSDMPHITSRICAICSAGHVLAAIHAVERSGKIKVSRTTVLFRLLMQMGMFIESHATHIYALALPDFVGAVDVADLATRFQAKFIEWTKLRSLGSAIQTTVGGRPFHPVNLHVGGLSHYPTTQELEPLLAELKDKRQIAVDLCELLLSFELPVRRTSDPCYVALIPPGNKYGYEGDRVRSSDGWEESIDNYREYLGEKVLPYSHAKKSCARGKPMMVGSLARLSLFGDRLRGTARDIYEKSPMSRGDTNTIWNNLGQAIEVVDAIDQAIEIISELKQSPYAKDPHDIRKLAIPSGTVTGATECPRGTLYHHFRIDEEGVIQEADLITPTAQNVGRMEVDIREVVQQAPDPMAADLKNHLETLLRAYDPCNTCATHMVSITYR